jgi:hypothetical protein
MPAMRDASRRLPTLIATSVVRGSQQGESHGGVYTIDFDRGEVRQRVDWNTSAIDFTGRGWDRGLRGIELLGERIYIAASDELFLYDRDFEIQDSYRNPYLKHCHEIFRREHLLFLTSTGFDSVLAFDLRRGHFAWGLHVAREAGGWRGRPFDPGSADGPPFENRLHLNSVFADASGLYVAGLRTEALLHVDGRLRLSEACTLPEGAHNARPFRDGVLFNDTGADCVRYAGRNGGDRAFRIRTYDPAALIGCGLDDSRVARQGFGRGLCAIDERLIAGGSSPSTISLYDLDAGRCLASINLSMDIRNAIHGLEPWPFGR